MSSEVCPFCGKTYKRLKSHLPHCKAAAASKAPQAKTPSPSLLHAGQAGPAGKGKGKGSTRALSPAGVSPTSLPPSAKKQKPKPPTPVSPPPLSASPPSPKPKGKSRRAATEAAASHHPVTAGSVEGTRSASGDPPSGSGPFLTDPLRSGVSAQSETSIAPDGAGFPPLPGDAKPKDGPKKTKRAQPLSTTKNTDPKINERSPQQQQQQPHARDCFWEGDKGEVGDLSVSDILLKSGNGHQARITIQDVKATLGRARGSSSSQSGGASLLSSETRLQTGPSPAQNRRDAAGVKPQPPVPSPPSPTSPTAALVPVVPPPSAVSRTVGRHVTALLSISPSPVQFSSPHRPPHIATDRWRPEGGRAEGAAAQRGLGQVRLRELPEWLMHRVPTRPREAVDMVQRGWRWYYRRYIDVRKGGVGGLGMLLAGYCVLSYVWSYPHIKRDRWRKYH